LIIPFTTVLAFAALYLPQPILPLLARQFGVEETDAALLMAVTMAPLGIAPIVYGFLVDRISAKRLLRSAVGLLMLSEILLAVAPSFWALLLLRFLQGLVLPAVLTALMTYAASTAAPGRVRHALNIYIGTSILGGVSGRLVGGFVSEYVHWRAAFALIAVLLCLAWWRLAQLRSEAQSEVDHIGFAAVRRTLAEPIYRNAYLGIFFVFFAFASLLNYLPFRLKALRPDIMESTIAMVYLGYLIGVVIALNGVRIAEWLGGELRGIFAGIALLCIGVVGMSTESVTAVFAFVFCICAGFFTIHSLLSAYLNHMTSGRKGVVNGLYLSSYYAGGALGGWLPGYIYRGAGWEAYLASLFTLLLLASWWIASMGRAGSIRPTS
jgi:YNFM family putative membrane transporter